MFIVGTIISGLALAGVVGVGALPAGAADQTGLLQLKGIGSYYAGDPAIVSLAANPAVTATYYGRIYNNGSDGGQYVLHMRQDGVPSSVVVTMGSLNVTKYVFSDIGYFTAPVEPGKTLTFTVKVTPPAGSAQGTHLIGVDLWSPTSAMYESGVILTNVKPIKGSTGFDLYARNGSQPFIGGSINEQMASAPSIRVGGSAAYTVRLENDGKTPTTIGLRIENADLVSCDDAFPLTVKDGLVDVTAAVLGGNYVTPVLAAGAHRDLVVTIKYPVYVPECQDDAYSAEALAGQNGLTAWYSYLNASTIGSLA